MAITHAYLNCTAGYVSPKFLSDPDYLNRASFASLLHPKRGRLYDKTKGSINPSVAGRNPGAAVARDWGLVSSLSKPYGNPNTSRLSILSQFSPCFSLLLPPSVEPAYSMP